MENLEKLTATRMLMPKLNLLRHEIKLINFFPLNLAVGVLFLFLSPHLPFNVEFNDNLREKNLLICCCGWQDSSRRLIFVVYK